MEDLFRNILILMNPQQAQAQAETFAAANRYLKQFIQTSL